MVRLVVGMEGAEGTLWAKCGGMLPLGFCNAYA